MQFKVFFYTIDFLDFLGIVIKLVLEREFVYFSSDILCFTKFLMHTNSPDGLNSEHDHSSHEERERV